MNKEIEIQKNINEIETAIKNLKVIFNDSETSLNEMCKISDYMRLLNVTDFHKSLFQ